MTAELREISEITPAEAREVADQLAELRSMVDAFFGRVSDAAAGSAQRVLGLLVAHVACVAGFVAYYKLWVGMGWYWCAPPAAVMLLPAPIVALGWYALTYLASLHSNTVTALTDSAAYLREFGGDLHLLATDAWSLRLRWRAYWLVARMLWRLYKLNDTVVSAGSSFAALVILANPIAWTAFAVAIILSVAASLLAFLTIFLHAAMTVLL